MEPSLKKYIYISTIIYFVTLLLFATVIPSTFGNIHKPISHDQIRISSISNTEWPLFQELLIRNTLVSLVIIIFGLVGTEIIPLAILTWNAVYIGELIAVVDKSDTLNIIISMLPHAIIEIPAMILCTAFACNLASKIYTLNTNKTEYSKNVFIIIKQYMIPPYIFYILPMIIIGCIIESTISLYIMRAIFNG